MSEIFGSQCRTVRSREFKLGSTDTLPNCIFDISYRPGDSLFSQPRLKSVLVDYSLENTFADQKLDIDMQKIPYQTSDLPKPSSEQAYPYPFIAETKSERSCAHVECCSTSLRIASQPPRFLNKAASLGEESLTECKPIANSKDPAITEVVPTNSQAKITVSQFIQGQGNYKPNAPYNVT